MAADAGQPPRPFSIAFGPARLHCSLGMKTRADYDRALSITRQTLREWDPYSLIGGGAPDDEFDSEAAQFVARVPGIQSPTEASLALSEIFSEAFTAEDFSPAACAAAGGRLFARLSEAGLV